MEFFPHNHHIGETLLGIEVVILDGIFGDYRAEMLFQSLIVFQLRSYFNDVPFKTLFRNKGHISSKIIAYAHCDLVWCANLPLRMLRYT